MAKYLFQGSLTVEGLRGLLREGGTKRREAVTQSVQAVGGTVETFYYAYGGDDFFIIVDHRALPGSECHGCCAI